MVVSQVCSFQGCKRSATEMAERAVMEFSPRESESKVEGMESEKKILNSFFARLRCFVEAEQERTDVRH